MPRAPSWSWSAPYAPPSQRGHLPGRKLSKDTLITEVYAQRQRMPPHLIERRLRFPATLSALQRFVPSPMPALHLLQHFRMLAGMHLLQLSLSRFLSGMIRLSHHHTVTGGTTHGRCTVHRAAIPPDGVPGFHEPDA